MIETHDLVKVFSNARALDGLTMQVPEAAVYGLVGPNGAGKTTLINHLTGAYRPTEGSVSFDGQPVFENPGLKARIACIPSDLYFSHSATVNDMRNLAAGMYPSFDQGFFERLHEIFPYELDRPLRTFSKGMQKQAAFWVALAQRPDFLFLDEPVDGLDPIARRTCWSLVMAEVAERGLTVLASSHNLRELEDVCDHVGIMDHGRMLIERSLDELQENIVKVMAVLPEGTEIPQVLDILHASQQGRLQTLIVRGSAEDVTGVMNLVNPVYMDVFPLSLEEIFVYELGGASDVSSLVL